MSAGRQVKMAISQKIVRSNRETRQMRQPTSFDLTARRQVEGLT